MQKTGFTPYSHQGDSSFWRTGVADIALGQELFSHLHQTNLDTKGPRISSIGSCFAQHVGKWLNAEGYSFNQSKLETTQVSSFAFGNLYTPKSLLQWLDISEQEKTLKSAIHCEDNRYFDLLRPSFQPAGFKSQTELVAARLLAVGEMVCTITETDILIFTLGLTETWRDKDGIYYPSCPGVISGKFEDSTYEFHNLSYEELSTDLKEIATKLKSINPAIQIILTVSPVPLTATMTDKHVMVANQHSKSLLRTVAGSLSDNHPEFSYFPSYELITVTNSGDFRFESNLRSVTPQAVNYVMQHFRSVIDKESHQQPVTETIAEPIEVQTPEIPHELICEDELLEAVKRLQRHQNRQKKLELTLVGDSHMGKLSKALNSMQVQHCGGMVMNGSAFSQNKLSLCETEYFVPLESPDTRRLWSAVYDNLALHEQDGTHNNSVVITNIGMQTHQNIAKFISWVNQIYPQGILEITTKDYLDYFNEKLTEQLSVIYKLHSNGHKVIVISDPPFSKFFDDSKDISKYIYDYYKAMSYVWSQFGICFYNAAAEFDKEIDNPEHYTSKITFTDGTSDWIHGNKNYYNWLAAKLMTLID